MARFKKARRVYHRAKKYHRKRHSTGGIIKKVAIGMGVGAVTRMASPMIRQFVPSFFGIAPETEVLLGIGAVDKMFLHKGGAITETALIIGAGLLGSSLAGMFTGGGIGISSPGTGNSSQSIYANDQ